MRSPFIIVHSERSLILDLSSVTVRPSHTELIDIKSGDHSEGGAK